MSKNTDIFIWPELTPIRKIDGFSLREFNAHEYGTGSIMKLPLEPVGTEALVRWKYAPGMQPQSQTVWLNGVHAEGEESRCIRSAPIEDSLVARTLIIMALQQHRGRHTR
jgi:hypothetical protein